MKNIISSSLLMVLLAGSGLVIAAENQGGMNHAAMQGMQHSNAAMQAHKGDGTVKRVDLEHRKVNLTHGPIKSLGWPGMTMDFKVKDSAILKGIKPGQKVEFDVIQEGEGQFFITRIVPLK